MDSVVLGVFRQFSLAFFLSIVGLRNGYAVYAALGESGIALALAALFVGTLSVAVGYLTGRYIFNINWIMLSGAICGGMTSTPGLGAAIDATKSNDPAAGYGATYPFALVGMVIFTLILIRFPLWLIR
jgi:putative transport protein